MHFAFHLSVAFLEERGGEGNEMKFNKDSNGKRVTQKQPFGEENKSLHTFYLKAYLSIFVAC